MRGEGTAARETARLRMVVEEAILLKWIIPISSSFSGRASGPGGGQVGGDVGGEESDGGHSAVTVWSRTTCWAPSAPPERV